MTEQSTAEAAEQGEQGKFECALRAELLALVSASVTVSLVAEQAERVSWPTRMDSTMLHSFLVQIC